MLIEDQRLLHEDLERLEQAISDRISEEPKLVRTRLQRDHEVASFLDRLQDQSRRLLELYRDSGGLRNQELQTIATGDQFDTFYKHLNEIKDFHKRYPNEPVENLERAYKRRAVGDGEPLAYEVDSMFTGEEGYGRFFDLNMLHEQYLNLPGVKRAQRYTYLQYLDNFDSFTPPQCPITKAEKMTDAYFQYLGNLTTYLESFLRRTKPLENYDQIVANFDQEFGELWEKQEVPGWQQENEPGEQTRGPETKGSGEGIWCDDCEKEFTNSNVYNHHLTGKKHIKNAEAHKAINGVNGSGITSKANQTSTQQLKDRAIAEREFRIRKLAAAMSTERSDTRHNVERRQGMTERERQQELALLYAERSEPSGPAMNGGESDDEDDDDKIYNPLKLPLAWDGKPIPFWLYKLHGLGVEFPCEVCGNFVYMGRRAFDKHFTEARHVYGLKCLGITNTALFREITKIEEAVRLWSKIQADKKKEKGFMDNVVEMEDSEGHVMPEKVYRDLERQGLL